MKSFFLFYVEKLFTTNMTPSLPSGTKWYRGTGNYKYKVVLPNGKIVQFGHKSYEQYKDQTPLRLYKHLDHGDERRRENYRKRHGGIRLKNGGKAVDAKYSPAWFSYYFLW